MAQTVELGYSKLTHWRVHTTVNPSSAVAKTTVGNPHPCAEDGGTNGPRPIAGVPGLDCGGRGLATTPLRHSAQEKS